MGAENRPGYELRGEKSQGLIGLRLSGKLGAEPWFSLTAQDSTVPRGVVIYTI